jgi:hypothetical protein
MNKMILKTRIIYFLWIPFMTINCFSQSNEVLKDSIRNSGIYGNNFIRNTFYTWTTEEQINDLRENKNILTKSKSETKGFSLYDMTLRDSTLKDDTLIKLLLEEQYAKKRFGWINGWSTIKGWEGEHYGHQLVKIVLNDSAIIGKLKIEWRRWKKSDPISFYDLKGNKLSTDYVIKNKHLVAAVYHEYQDKGTRVEWKRKKRGSHSSVEKKRKVSNEGFIPIREFVIINERMIKNWSYGTAEIKREIVSEIELLKQFQKSKEAKQKAYRGYWLTEWFETEEPKSDFEIYKSLTCFQNDHYLFNSKRIQLIISELESALSKQSEEIVK